LHRLLDSHIREGKAPADPKRYPTSDKMLENGSSRILELFDSNAYICHLNTTLLG
jgi:hypothetical protein